ncbi:MAG: glycoside hydrolase family 16 protein, partial [Actinomycetota bacterium]
TTVPTTTAPTAPPTSPTTAATTTTTQAPSGGGRVIWEEQFDTLDPNTWTREHSTYGDGNNELQCYRPENVSVQGGRLILRAVTERYTCPNGSTRNVTSGMIRSRGVTFSPGQAIEFRVKLTPADPDDQGGLWPAVWASAWGDGGWPRGGELDWLEVMTAENPRRAMFSMHYADSSGSHELQNRGVIGQDYFSDSWHTVRFDYGYNGVLVWYLDGREAFRVEAADTIQGYPTPFDQSIGQIKINLALGGRPGPLSPNAVGTAGATFEMDFIRILQL